MLRFKVSSALPRKIIVTEIKRPEPDAVLVLRKGAEVLLTEAEYELLCSEALEPSQRKRIAEALGKPTEVKPAVAPNPEAVAKAKAAEEAAAKAAEEAKAKEVQKVEAKK